MNKTIIGFDFSINKPTVCVLNDHSYQFISWPYNLRNNLINIYKKNGIKIIDRKDEKLSSGNISEKIQWEIKNARYLSDLIVTSLKEYLNNDTIITFEGLSYGSGGNIGLQLSGYKYILMDKFLEYIPIKNMFTYAPISLKKSAGCAKKGSGKKDMINAFLLEEENVTLKNLINKDKESFLKKGGKNWITHLDDFVDAYYLIKTYLNKDSF